MLLLSSQQPSQYLGCCPVSVPHSLQLLLMGRLGQITDLEAHFWRLLGRDSLGSKEKLHELAEV